MEKWLKIIQHLLPTGKAWKIAIDKYLRQFFAGLTILPDELQVFIANVLMDFYPRSTTSLNQWFEQFNLVRSTSDVNDRKRLASAWRLNNYQSPKTIQDKLQAAGFDLYIHEWWELPLESPAIVKNPFYYIGDGNPTYLCAIGNKYQVCGNERAVCGYFANEDGDILANKTDNSEVYTLPLLSSYWHYIFYVGGEEFPDFANVPSSRKNELETLLLKISPSEQCIGVMVNYV